MEMLERFASTARRALRLPRRVSEEEFKEWRRRSPDPLVTSGRCYVPMPGFESTRHYRDKQNLHHLGRYEWAARTLSAGGRVPRRVLDCACGSGYGAAVLAARAGHVDAVDSSDAALRHARQRFDRPNVSWHELDAADLSDRFEPECFDAVVSFQTIECLDDDAGFLRDVARLLRPGGVLLIDTPLRKRRDDRPENPHHRRHYAVDEWVPLLERHFDVVEAFDALPDLPFLARCALPGGGSLARCVKTASVADDRDAPRAPATAP